jgi:alpha-1,2-mannosyltransferase
MIAQAARAGAASGTAIDWSRLARRALLATVLVLAVITVTRNALGSRYGLDFHGIWRAGHDLLSGRSPYLAPDWRTLLVASNAFIPPPPLAVLAAPFSALPFAGAVALWNLLCVGAFAGALRLVGVRDLRVYVVALCSFPLVASVGLGQPDGLFALGAAIAWRYRDCSRGALAVGALIAAKLLAWPLLVWLLLTRRVRCSLVAVVSAVALLAGSWALIGFHGLLDYPRLLAADARAFEARSHSVLAAMMRFGASAPLAAVLAIGCAGAVALAAVRLSRRSDLGYFTAAITAGLLLSPVLWSHYLVLLLIPLAIRRPRLDGVWLLTAVFWLSPVEPAHGWQIVLVLIATAAIALLASQPLREAAVAPAGVGRPGGAGDHLPRADDHGRELRPRDRGVEHLATQEERARGGVGDDHRDRELDPLTAMDRAGVGEPQAV